MHCFRRVQRRPCCKSCAYRRSFTLSGRKQEYGLIMLIGLNVSDWWCCEKMQMGTMSKRRCSPQAQEGGWLSVYSGTSNTQSASDSLSSVMSPVLLAMMLQMTPLPSLLSNEVEKKEEYLQPITIPMSPVLNASWLLRSILYLSMMMANIPHSLRSGEKPVLHCITVDAGSANE